ncbi:MAG: aspartate aminotransferase family protein [Nitrospinae bacterium]|nr:aspartate aminotransferase family protein [Nitrospinota bacterium]
MKKDKIAELSNKCIVNTYNRYPVTLVKGRGLKVWDSEGKEYSDFVSGIAVNNLGHCHPSIVNAIKKQAQELIHTSNLYHTMPQAELAKLLTKKSFADKVFFCNSGAEANEAAIKLARKYSKDNYGEDRFEIITMYKSFHGRTIATISATGQEKFHKGFEPLLPGFRYVPFNDIPAVEKAANGRTCAILVEPVQCEGGVNMPDKDYLRGLREICFAKRLLLIFDEVQTGMGRTGKFFAYEHFGISPDIMTLAKSLGGGVAIGAMLARDEVAKSFIPGTHASTFGGNPLACAAGIAAVKAIDKNILSHCKRTGDYFIRKLKRLREKYSFINDVRGIGLMIGMEMSFPVRGITEECLKRGFLVNYTMDRVLRFLPPLNVKTKEIDRLIAVLDEIFGEIKNKIFR